MKKIKLLPLVVFIFLLVPKTVFAGELKETFYKKANSVEEGHQLIFPSYDNDGKIDGHLIFYSAGDLNISKYNLENELLWTKSDIFDENVGYDIIFPENDYGLDVNGEIDSVMIKYKPESDETEWVSQYGGNKTDEILIVVNSYDNKEKHDGYLAIIITESTDISNINSGYVMVKFDLEGNKLWDKNINNIANVVFKEDGYIILNESDKLIFERPEDYEEVKINFHGNKMILSKNKNNEHDGYIVVGTTSRYLYEPNEMLMGNGPLGYSFYDTKNVITKLDTNGNILWTKEHTKYETTVLYDAILSKTPTGEIDGYIAVGAAFDEPDANNQSKSIGLIIKYDLDGNLIFEKEYKTDSPFLTAISENYDINGNFNGYVIAGYDGYTYTPPVMPTNATRKITPKRLNNIEEDTKNEMLAYNDVKYKQVIIKYTYQNYEIEKKVETGGSVAIYENAYPGTIVPIKVAVEEGYILEKLTIQDADGTDIKIDNNTFVMPEGKVTVIATFKKLSNPQTSALGYTLVFIILLVSIVTFTVRNQQTEEQESEIEML